MHFDVRTAEGESEPDASSDGNSNPQAQSEAHQALATFWDRVTDEIKKIGTMDLKTQALPLARIKKIMKLDEDVKMISAEAPMLFAKAAEIFIHELTLRAWIHTEDNKRRTLQRNDIAMAITKYDQFDFLIDIVPRDELKPNKSRDDGAVRTTSMNPDQVHYYFQLAQQHQAALQQTNQQTGSANQATIQIVQPGQVQTVAIPNAAVEQVTQVGTNSATTTTVAAQQHQAAAQQPAQVIQLQQTGQVAAAQPAGGIQIVQQIVAPSGDIQQVPIQLTPQQLQMIRMQMQGGTNQPIIIQTAPLQTIQQAGQPQIIQVAPQSGGGTPVYLTQAADATNGENE
ncbi:nuclear transcription factor Y subunit gamma-like isoform X2 [Schistocerca serialis cubense]|uniref:nuclear transcription factor Y subunit gamma-like isoform X2 n=1 Tax=Schistocerca serialis cubense TaxID=2023355 RepID=UPI00214E4473|nr:nuclear transcription factor Y subunit gamma-like isoform X2 [Schistocerca serialis cubense]